MWEIGDVLAALELVRKINRPATYRVSNDGETIVFSAACHRHITPLYLFAHFGHGSAEEQVERQLSSIMKM